MFWKSHFLTVSGYARYWYQLVLFVTFSPFAMQCPRLASFTKLICKSQHLKIHIHVLFSIYYHLTVFLSSNWHHILTQDCPLLSLKHWLLPIAILERSQAFTSEQCVCGRSQRIKEEFCMCLEWGACIQQALPLVDVTLLLLQGCSFQATLIYGVSVSRCYFIMVTLRSHWILHHRSWWPLCKGLTRVTEKWATFLWSGSGGTIRPRFIPGIHWSELGNYRRHSSCHWPSSDVDGYEDRHHIAIPRCSSLNQSWVAPCLGALQTGGHRANVAVSRTWCLWVWCLLSHGLMRCKLVG